MKQLFNLYKTKNQNIALFVKIKVLVWASSNPMGQVQNTLRLSLGQVTVSVLFLTLHRYHIRVRPKGPCMGVAMGWTQGSMHGVGVGLEVKVWGFFFFFKNDSLFSFQSRTEDLTHNVRGLCPRLSITSALYTALK